MFSATRFATVVFVISIGVSLAQGRELNQNRGGCGQPPSGTWMVTHFTAPPNEAEGLVSGRTFLNLTENFENIYSGKGSGIYYLADVFDLGLLDGYVYFYQVLGSYNPRTCTLTGTLYNTAAEPYFVDAITWVYDSQKFVGGAVFTNDTNRGNVPLPTRSGHEVTFVA